MRIITNLKPGRSALLNFILVVFAIFGSCITSYSQFDQKVEFVKITLNDGSTVSGILEERQESYIKVIDKGVSKKIMRSDIRILSDDENSIFNEKKESTLENYADNYFATNSALGVPKGKIYFRNTLLTWSQLQYGVTENFSVAFGVDNISPFLFQQAPIVAITPKFNTNYEEINFALGTTIVWTPGGRVSLNFATLTIGNRSNNLSLGMIHGNSSDSQNSAIFYTLASKLALSKKIAFKGELVYLRGEGTLFGGSLENHFKNGLALGFGIIGDSFNNNFPLASVTFPVGSKKQSEKK